MCLLLCCPPDSQRVCLCLLGCYLLLPGYLLVLRVPVKKDVTPASFILLKLEPFKTPFPWLQNSDLMFTVLSSCHLLTKHLRTQSMRKKSARCQVYQQVTGAHWCLWDICNLILLILLKKPSLHEAQRNSTAYYFFHFLPIESRNNRLLVFIILVSKMGKIRKPGCLFSINYVNEAFLPICFMMIVKQLSLHIYMITYIYIKNCVYFMCIWIIYMHTSAQSQMSVWVIWIH